MGNLSVGGKAGIGLCSLFFTSQIARMNPSRSVTSDDCIGIAARGGRCRLCDDALHVGLGKWRRLCAGKAGERRGGKKREKAFFGCHGIRSCRDETTKKCARPIFFDCRDACFLSINGRASPNYRIPGHFSEWLSQSFSRVAVASAHSSARWLRRLPWRILTSVLPLQAQIAPNFRAEPVLRPFYLDQQPADVSVQTVPPRSPAQINPDPGKWDSPAVPVTSNTAPSKPGTIGPAPSPAGAPARNPALDEFAPDFAVLFPTDAPVPIVPQIPGGPARPRCFPGETLDPRRLLCPAAGSRATARLIKSGITRNTR